MKRKWWIVGILVLVEVLVCAGILAMAWNIGGTFGDVRFLYLADTCIEETIEETFEVDGPVTLDLEGVSDSAVVMGDARDRVQLTARLSACGEDEEDARQKADVQINQNGNRITIRVVRPKTVYLVAGYTGRVQVDYQIHVPAETSVRMDTASGNLEVFDVTGPVDLESVSGNLAVEGVKGEVSARTSSGDAALIGLDDAGDVEVRTTSGDLELRDVTARSLTARTSSGDITLADLDCSGDVEVRTTSGDVELEEVDAANLLVETSSGTIQADKGLASGALNLETTSGHIDATDIDAASYRLSSSSGDLTLAGCGGPLDLRTISGAVEATGGREALLEIETSSGTINYSGSLASEGEHRISSVSGNVYLLMPSNSAFDLDVETISGAIQTEFAVTMTDFDKRHIAGEVNGGGSLLQIATSSGDVTIKSEAE
jgi:DUF4097 and DUF4098 domain-containing protein YvlB